MKCETWILYEISWNFVNHKHKLFVRDEEGEIRRWSRQSSRILGFMLHPDTWQPFIIQRLGEEPSFNQILVLAGKIILDIKYLLFFNEINR